ncbi:MAG TPA: phytanoyl-CoA dioxygenase family protein [Stellaceae bacterium]|nr:phytanoyl-CoA dioxygenase family protein [Stellaceae bacterium]
MIDPAAIAAAHAQYRAEGYAVLRGVFAADEVATIAAAFDRQWQQGMAHRASFRHGNLFYRLGKDAAIGKIVRLVQWPSYADPVLEGVRRDPRWLPLLEPLIGRDIKQIINQLHWKPPGAQGAEFAFHQDARFRRPRAAFRNLATSYVQTGLAIDAHRAANGGMRVYPGSHRLGEKDLAGKAPVLDQAMADARLVAAGLDPKKLVDLELDPGDVAFWNVYTIHGSGPNATSGDRRFYLNGYVRAADCDRGEWAFRDGKPAPLGKPVLVHFDDLHKRPGPHYVED